MNGRRRIGVLPAGAALLWPVLAGCANPTFDEDAGTAVEQNKTAHIVHPEPAPVDLPELDGARAAIAIDRYKRGQVIRPRRDAIVIE